MACAGLLLAMWVAIGTATNLSETVRDKLPASPSSPAAQNEAPRPANRAIDLSVVGALHQSGNCFFIGTGEHRRSERESSAQWRDSRFFSQPGSHRIRQC
jgi:hypothetical protein